QAGTDNVAFQGTTTLTALTINVAGAVTHASGTRPTGRGAGAFPAGPVVVGGGGGGKANFRTPEVNPPGRVAISEDSAMDLPGTSTAGTLSLTAAGNITVAGLLDGLSAPTTAADFHSPLVINGQVRFVAAAVTAGDITINGAFQAPNASGSLL